MKVVTMTKKAKRGRPPGPTDKTVDRVNLLYTLKAQGHSMIEIAKKLGVTRAYVYHLYWTYEPG